jgi:hypothetical protein
MNPSMDVVSFRALCLVLGEAVAAGKKAEAIVYRWRCGCQAECADGQRCTHISFCAAHSDGIPGSTSPSVINP